MGFVKRNVGQYWTYIKISVKMAFFEVL